MKATLFQNKISIRRSPIHGFGVFADADMETGDLIEECYAIITTHKDMAFRDYYFAAGERDCIPAGFAMLYNHSATPNATYEFDPVHRLIVFRAVAAIQRGEEIFTSYGPQWFSCRSLKIKKIPWWFQVKLFLQKHKRLIRALTVLMICYLTVVLVKRLS